MQTRNGQHMGGAAGLVAGAQLRVHIPAAQQQQAQHLRLLLRPKRLDPVQQMGAQAFEGRVRGLSLHAYHLAVRLVAEFLLRNGGDIFQALLDLYDYVQAKIDNQHLGEIGAMTGIIRCNSGMQKNGLLEMLDAETLLQRLGGAVNPDLLDLRQDRDLGDILGTLLVVAAPMIYTGLQAGGDPGTRDRLENILNIFKRGMGKRPTAEIENKEIT